MWLWEKISSLSKGRTGNKSLPALKAFWHSLLRKAGKPFQKSKGKVFQSCVIVIQSVKQQPKGMFYRSRTAAEEQWQFWHSNFFPIYWYWHNIWPKQIYWCWVLASPILMQITRQSSSRNLYHKAKKTLWCGNINRIIQINFMESKIDQKLSLTGKTITTTSNQVSHCCECLWII